MYVARSSALLPLNIGDTGKVCHKNSSASDAADKVETTVAAWLAVSGTTAPLAVAGCLLPVRSWQLPYTPCKLVRVALSSGTIASDNTLGVNEVLGVNKYCTTLRLGDSKAFLKSVLRSIYSQTTFVLGSQPPSDLQRFAGRPWQRHRQLLARKEIGRTN
jgi:hypothetical protein